MGYRRETDRNIKKWFKNGVVFTRAYSTNPSTPQGTISILSGRMPFRHGVRAFYQKLPEKTVILPDMLKRAGYATAAIVSNMVLTDEAIAMAHRFDYYDDYVTKREAIRKVWERIARHTTDNTMMYLSTRDSKDRRPLFLYVHYQDPHGPYNPPEDKPVDFSHAAPLKINPRRVPYHQRFKGLTDGLEYVDRYDEEIAYTDHHLDRLFVCLTKHGLLEDTLVVLTADHGESMMEHNHWFIHGRSLYNEQIHVPLLIYHDRLQARTVTSPVSTLGIVPTILKFIEVKTDRSFTFGDLLSDSPPNEAFAEYGFSKEKMTWAVFRDQNKWIAHSNPMGRLLDAWHVDLAADPGEMRYRRIEPRDSPFYEVLLRFARLEAKTRDPANFVAGKRLIRPKIDKRANREALQKLKALGYVY
jgi:arylsulfatase A-like enzyme